MINDIKNIKLYAVLLFVTGALVLAGFRVYPYVKNRRKPIPVTAITIQVVDQNYSKEELLKGADALEQEVTGHVVEILRNLSRDQRPSEDQRKEIAMLIADFVVMSRTASRIQWVEHFQSNGLKPPSQMIDDDIEKMDKIWSHSNAWARHAEIDPVAIRAEPLYKNHTAIQDHPMVYGMYHARPFYEHNPASNQQPRLYSAYEIFIPVTVPTIDAKAQYPLELGLIVVNDGPDAQWSVARTRFTGLPNGAICYLPYP